MKYIEKISSFETVINKSRFIATLFPVKNILDVNEILKRVNKQYYDATHNCYAYILDKQTIQKTNDDGEPSRTAGMPILEALLQNNMDDILCVVTRYYGGVKLGKGGLIRAYMNSALNAIKNAPLFEEQIKIVYRVVIPYSFYDNFIHITRDDAFFLKEDFKENVTSTFYLINGDIKTLKKRIHHKLKFEKIDIITKRVPL